MGLTEFKTGLVNDKVGELVVHHLVWNIGEERIGTVYGWIKTELILSFSNNLFNGLLCVDINDAPFALSQGRLSDLEPDMELEFFGAEDGILLVEDEYHQVIMVFPESLEDAIALVRNKASGFCAEPISIGGCAELSTWSLDIKFQSNGEELPELGSFDTR